MVFATKSDLIHANNVLGLAKTFVNAGHTLQFLQLDNDMCLGVSLMEKTKMRKAVGGFQDVSLGIATVHDASCLGQPNEAYPHAYTSLLATKTICDGKAKTDLLDGGSSKIHRTIQPTLACETQLCCEGC